MADEFAKGLAILTSAGMVWMAVSSWLTTESFEGTQLIAPPPEDLGTYGELALVARDISFWFAVFGVLTFWILIPVGREIRRSIEARAEES
ncbi:MAG: hypothetical protein ACLFNI_00110 [Natronomonas sp.]